MFKELVTDMGCEECGFALWVPVVEGQASKVGIYNDARFPGRSIVALRDHFESLEEVPASTLQRFLKEIRAVSAAIRAETGAARVNLSILGNRDPHVHAHLIPRYPELEQFPTDSPWKDPREPSKLPSEDVAHMRFVLLARLGRRLEQKGSAQGGESQRWPVLFTDRELFAAG